MGVSPAVAVLGFSVELASELKLFSDVPHGGNEAELGFLNVIRVNGELDFIVDKCEWCVIDVGFLQKLMSSDGPKLADNRSSALEEVVGGRVGFTLETDWSAV